MTKYKELAEEANDKLAEALHQNDVLKEHLLLAQSGFIDEACTYLDNEEARKILGIFAERAKNKDELVLLIRALAKF